jgi:hypothetical protein
MDVDQEIAATLLEQDVAGPAPTFTPKGSPDGTAEDIALEQGSEDEDGASDSGTARSLDTAEQADPNIFGDLMSQDGDKPAVQFASSSEDFTPAPEARTPRTHPAQSLTRILRTRTSTRYPRPSKRTSSTNALPLLNSPVLRLRRAS